ncbi:MAG: ABC transporter permease [Aestuariibacter sp.]
MFSSLEFGPILRTLMRNKVGALLIALQIAVTMTIVVNAVFIIGERTDLMARDSGVDELNSFHITSMGYANDFNHKQSIEEDLLAIRNTPGVLNATTINSVPISGGGWSMSLQVESGENKDDTPTAVYMVDEQAIETLDVELIAGSNFTAEEIRDRDGDAPGWPQNIIITKALANSIFPDIPVADVVGKTLFIENIEPIQVIGIIDKLQAPWIGWDSLESVMLSPERIMYDTNTRYFIRTEPGMRDQLMPEIEELLATRMQGRIVEDLRSFEEVRERSYQRHAAMIKILTAVMITLVIITGLGIIGLASFNVNRRKKQIGTRRALGASQLNIIRYFMLENFIITTMGVLVGAGLTIGLNMTLVSMFELGRMDWFYIPLGMACLWVLGQIAVFGPAKKAAGIPPALATRTV